MKNTFRTGWLLLLLTFSVQVIAVELMTWDRMPLEIKLRIDEERVIIFEKNIRVGMESGLADRLRVQSAAGTLYLKATAPIALSRLQLQVPETGEIILLDIETVEGKSSADNQPLEPVRVLDARKLRAEANQKAQFQGPELQRSLDVPAPVALTRYAAQSLYAPLRTIKPIPGLRKIPLRVNGTLRLLPTTAIVGTPLVAYALGDFTVTAVQLTNTGREAVPLDPRKLKGDFYAATFQHPWLGATGSSEDTSVVYLVTQGKGLNQALLPGAIISENEPRTQQGGQP